MLIKVTRTDVWYVETEEYTISELRKDEKERGLIGLDLALDLGDYRGMTVKYSELKN